MNTHTDQFDEGRDSDKRDTLDGKTQEFDYEAVDRDLGTPIAEGIDYTALIVALERINEFVFGIDKLRPTTIGLRYLALMWVVNPDLFKRFQTGEKERSISINEMIEQVGVHPVTLARYTAEASRRFGIRNRGQAHAGNFKMKGKQNDNNDSTEAKAA